MFAPLLKSNYDPYGCTRCQLSIRLLSHRLCYVIKFKCKSIRDRALFSIISFSLSLSLSFSACLCVRWPHFHRNLTWAMCCSAVNCISLRVRECISVRMYLCIDTLLHIIILFLMPKVIGFEKPKRGREITKTAY